MTLPEDIANFYNFKTTSLSHFKKILNFLAGIEPGRFSVHNLSKNLSIDDKTASNFLINLNDTGLINLVYPKEEGNSNLRRPTKVFLNNTNLQFALEGNINNEVKTGSVRELFFIQSLINADISVFHSKKGDYAVNEMTFEVGFEVGGKNKTAAQLKGISNGFLIKDDFFIADNHSIPLMFFGFLY